jgi:hypothetical protein
MSSLTVPASSSSMSHSPSPVNGPFLKRSASGQPLDALAARRCWARLDAGNSNFVTANELHTYLQRFVTQQKSAAVESQRRRELEESMRWQEPIHPPADDGEEEKKSSVPVSAASAVPARPYAASHFARSGSDIGNGLTARASALVAQASAVTLKDIEEMLTFADANCDGKLDFDELMAALGCFTNPTPVTLAQGRFESRILTEGLAGARPKKQIQPEPISAGFGSSLGVGIAASASPSPSPPQPAPAVSRSSLLGPLPPIFASASLRNQSHPVPSANGVSSSFPLSPPPPAAQQQQPQQSLTESIPNAPPPFSPSPLPQASEIQQQPPAGADESTQPMDL